MLFYFKLKEHKVRNLIIYEKWPGWSRKRNLLFILFWECTFMVNWCYKFTSRTVYQEVITGSRTHGGHKHTHTLIAPLDDQLECRPCVMSLTLLRDGNFDTRTYAKEWPCSLIAAQVPSTRQCIVASGTVRTVVASAPEMASEWTRTNTAQEIFKNSSTD